jgi:hypothetical protein
LFNSVSYVFLLLCMFRSVYSVFIVPTGTLRLPRLRFFRAFSSVVRQMPGYNSQRRGTARTLPKLIVLFYVLFVCKCVLFYGRRVSTQLQLTNIYHIIYHIVSYIIISYHITSYHITYHIIYIFCTIPIVALMVRIIVIIIIIINTIEEFIV